MENIDKVHPPRIGGGPHGLGDPNDKSLRKVEANILIPKRMREKASKNCTTELDALQECCEKSGIRLTSKCQDQNTAVLNCIKSFMTSEEFKVECTKEYLEERSRYRATGKRKEKTREEMIAGFKNIYS